MSLGHEKLDVYRLSIEYVAWIFTQVKELKSIHRHARDQRLRASQSISLNIAEGNGKTATGDRRKYFEIARGSALECAEIQDVLRVADALEEEENQEPKRHLDRIAVMLSRLGGRGYLVEEEKTQYPVKGLVPDFDFDFDFDSNISHPNGDINPDTNHSPSE